MIDLKHTARLSLLSLSVAGVALSAGSALAAPNPIYGGGGTLSEPSLRLWADCLGAPLSEDTGQQPSAFAACTTPEAKPFEYLLTAIGSGGGLTSLIEEVPSSTTSSNGNAGGTAYGSATDPGNGFGAYPYPHWDLTDSDAPSDSLSPITGSTNSIQQDYDTGFATANGKVARLNRGEMWAVPVAATPVTVPYNPTNMHFVLTPATGDNEDHKLQLSKDAVCYIYTRADSNGNTVPGAANWSNPIFVSNNFGGTQVAATGTPAQIPNPYNSVFHYNTTTHKFVITSTFTSSPATTIHPFARSDSSGTTYLMTLWLETNCGAFNNSTLAAATGTHKVTTSAFGTQSPATSIVFPAWVLTTYRDPVTGPGTPAKGSGGMEKAVQNTVGGIGYVTPTSDEPVKAGTVPSAYVENRYRTNQFHQYVEPTVTSVVAAISNLAPPNLTNSCVNPANPTGPKLACTHPAAWGSTLNRNYFHTTQVGSYPAVGLTYLMGYRCYQHDTGNDPYTAVLDYVGYFTNNGAGGNTNADNLLLANGLVPVDRDTGVNVTSHVGFTQAVYNVVANDAGTKLVPVVTGETFPPGHHGPYECPFYATDATHE